VYRKAFGPESVLQGNVQTGEVNPVVGVGMTEYDSAELRKIDMSLEVGQTTGAEIDCDRG
jgi:hypothetical protein